ncbi:serine/threonine phosphatase [Synechocystis sp. PCC 7509]|uniref:serine/threonine phosphatase n=1 Tax=Synechocystis sp. PCC 7509 TaxID=927677 RepID=UPI000302CEF9|nr:serine/threonine phosphatase [Synechocystis sp. PCC 7509]
MLICPQCKSENPAKNKFCQNCGTSLSYKICPQCSSKVALNQNKCDNCGTKTGLVWWAIISKNKQLAPMVASQEANSDVSSSLLTIGLYLDSQQRYQVLEPLPPPAPKEIQCKVLDCQPLQISLLKADTTNTVEIGETAKTYLLLHSQLGEVIPQLHDAWQHEGRQVLLLSDRSLWRHLPEVWQDNNTTALQIDQLLLAMTELWAALIPWNACRSLLELSNLRINSQGTLALQRLYLEPIGSINNEQATSLQELGKLWQHLFGESQRTKVGAMVELLAQMQAGEIHTVEQLQFLLMEIISQLPPLPATSPVSTAATNQAEISSSSSDIDPSTVIQLDKPSTNVMQTDDTPTIVLPMQLIGLEDAGLTDVGGQRQHNEDCFGIETAVNKLEFPRGKNIQARGLYILCDGMGGHAGGEVASSLAVKTLQQYFQSNWQSAQLPSEEVIREAVQLANKVIYDANQQDARSGVGRMGTTLVMVLLQDNQVAVAHVGDSRLYRLNRKIGIEQVTLDHEVGQREILRGVEPSIAYARPDAYQLTQALGPRDENYVNPDVKFLELNEDTLFILASDGLSDNNLVEQYWKSHLDPLLSSSSNLDQGVNALIDLANQYNGHDNITAVLVRAKVAPRNSSQF